MIDFKDDPVVNRRHPSSTQLKDPHSTLGQHYTIRPKSKVKLSQNFVITVFGMLSGFQNGMNEVI